MKKLLSILLLSLLVFNMTGFSIYSLLQTNGIENKGLSGNMVLKVPFSMPYVNDWQSSQDVDQKILHNNSFYNVVSSKINNDTLYLECQFDESARDYFWQLVSNFDDQVKTSQDSENHTGSFMKNLLKEYMSTNRRLHFYLIEWITHKTFRLANIASLPEVINQVTSPPPRYS